MADEIELKVPGERELVPANLHNAVIVDLIDLGVVEETWDGRTTQKRKCRYVLELEAKRKDGKQFNVGTRRFTATMGERSKLEEFARDVIGKPFTDAERRGFKASSLVGKQVKVLTKHAVAKDGKTYANIAAVMPGGTFAGSGLYKRWVPEDKYNSAKGTEKKAAPVAEEQLPF